MQIKTGDDVENIQSKLKESKKISAGQLFREDFVSVNPVLNGIYLSIPSVSPSGMIYIYSIFKGWVHINHAPNSCLW